MNSITVGGHVINLDAITWANLDFQWRKDVPQYEQDRNGFAVTVAVKHETCTGIQLAFIGGSTLTVPDGTPGCKRLRAALGSDMAVAPMAEDAYNPTESGILSALPRDLRDAILTTQGG